MRLERYYHTSIILPEPTEEGMHRNRLRQPGPALVDGSGSRSVEDPCVVALDLVQLARFG